MLSPTPENLRAQQPAANAERDREAAKELGAVHWQRDLEMHSASGRPYSLWT
jgi:hypothetical protein